MGEWGIVPLVLNLCIGWRLRASLTFQPFYFHLKVCHYPLNYEAGGQTPELVWKLWRGEKSFAAAGS
jgi:hypothetical protein